MLLLTHTWVDQQKKKKKKDRSQGRTFLLPVNGIPDFQWTLEQSLAGHFWREQASGFDLTLVKDEELSGFHARGNKCYL